MVMFSFIYLFFKRICVTGLGSQVCVISSPVSILCLLCLSLSTEQEGSLGKSWIMLIMYWVERFHFENTHTHTQIIKSLYL